MGMQAIKMSGATGLFSVINQTGNANSTKNTGVSFESMLTKNVENNTENNTTKSKSTHVQNLTSPEKNDAFPTKDTIPEHDNSTSLAVNSDTEVTASDCTVSKKEKELFEKIDILLEEVKIEVSKSLDISEEELVQVMEEMGLTMMVLLDPAVLQQLVLENAGTDDITFLLTDETAAATLGEMLHTVNQLVEETDIPDDILQKIMNSNEFLEYLNGIGSMDETTESTLVKGVADISNEKENISNEMLQTNQLTDEAVSFMDETRILGTLNEEIQDTGVKNKETLKEQKLSESVADESEISLEVVKVSAVGGNSAKGETHEESKDLKDSDKTNVSQSQQFIQSLANASGVGTVDFTEHINQVEQMREIANQIIEQIKINIKPAMTSMELQLNPEHLGKVNLNVVSKDGMMTARFTAQTQAAKEAIESQIQVLRTNLENQGIKIEVVEVTLSEFGFHENNGTSGGKEKQQSGNSKRKTFLSEDLSEFDNIAMAEAIAAGMLEQSGSTVDYSA